ncbi:Oidioi.mRNA.OKI2018_I69.PAR.g12341.t1.cds [Oikopleura dioica]|uniref:Oidioi.mRNA.OKI2018_I69.PAR.g12341.t1.cds n=1 Tax=Oikopleura dioica TaxID=34765 RepID=A0ABN7S317_OIKDI|nr:Oidioi.mRNA.OKI2018_I69.PAR.g12341.t1.cds [Oikopleura dioica]
MRSDGTGVEVDYDEPGSPLDRYLANLDLEFHPAAGTEELSLAQQLHNVQAESPEQTSAAIKEDLSQIEQDLSPIMFAKNLCSKMRRGAAEYLQGLQDNHLIKASKLEYDSRTFLQQQLADFQLDDALEEIGESGCEEPDYRSQIEKDLDDGRRDHLTENHDYCCPSSSSLASILAQQVAKKSAKIEAEEFSCGD